MPKADRRRSSLAHYKHSPSARPTIIDTQKVGLAEGAPAEELLASIGRSSPTPTSGDSNLVATQSTPQLTKREKQQVKHEAFINRLGSSLTPYSKSHTRRLKRKAKGSLITDLTEMTAAIDDITEHETAKALVVANSQSRNSQTADRPRIKPGQIGEGKRSTLSVSQRKRILQAERQRQPQIVANPAFSANPFETIRIHAENTLVNHKVVP